MQFVRIRALVALIAATIAPAAHTARENPRHHYGTRHHQGAPRHRRSAARDRGLAKLPGDYAKWARVAGCETGGWRVLGYDYPDSLGISRANFIAFGGTPLPPGTVSRAATIMQIHVADRLIARYGMGVPDQAGCSAW